MIKERLLKYLDFKRITKSYFEKSMGMGNGYINNVKSIGSEKLENIIKKYPDLNIEWLISGCGEMIKSEDKLHLYLPYKKDPEPENHLEDTKIDDKKEKLYKEKFYELSARYLELQEKWPIYIDEIIERDKEINLLRKELEELKKDLVKRNADKQNKVSKK